MEKKIRRIGIFAVGLLTAIFFLVPITTVTVRLPKEDNKLVGASHIKNGQSIELHYFHSVEGTKVVGLFTVDEYGRLLASETRMMSVGTGMPNQAPERTRREGDWLVVDEQRRILPEIRFYLVPVNQTRIRIDGHWLPLKPLPSGSLLRIGIETPRLAQWATWSLINLNRQTKPVAG